MAVCLFKVNYYVDISNISLIEMMTASIITSRTTVTSLSQSIPTLEVNFIIGEDKVIYSINRGAYLGLEFIRGKSYWKHLIFTLSPNRKSVGQALES